ncbi:hypothetical protein BBJ28_00016215 [Nothophytophthora sp. Chile5]|nr:hypothetical protein BBJ28_00016215 [Nothophytophthora sp. Chile5]
MQDAPPPLTTEALVQQSLSTRTELETWIEAQKSRILEEKRYDQLQAQEHTRATDEAQRKREELQQSHQALAASTILWIRSALLLSYGRRAEKSKKEPVVKELFGKTMQEDAKLKQLLAGACTDCAYELKDWIKCLLTSFSVFVSLAGQ